MEQSRLVYMLLEDFKTVSRCKLLVIAVLLSSALSAGLMADSEQICKEHCPPIAFVKRRHFDRPFGIGSMIGWD
ncbi:MAG: hypothetical protein ACYS8Z_14130, partial [Planctomycetota bacterium]